MRKALTKAVPKSVINHGYVVFLDQNESKRGRFHVAIDL